MNTRDIGRGVEGGQYSEPYVISGPFLIRGPNCCVGDDKMWVWVELINACLELVARYLARGEGREVDNRPLMAA